MAGLIDYTPFGLGLGAFNSLAGLGTNLLNYSNQQDQLNWMKQAQQTTWNREDNAVQRRSADMLKAGINPLLAAGSPAQASAPVQVGAPQLGQTDFTQAMGNALMAKQLMTADANIATTQAQKMLLDTQREKVSQETQTQWRLNDRMDYDNAMYRKYGLPSNASGEAVQNAMTSEMINSLLNLAPGFKAGAVAPWIGKILNVGVRLAPMLLKGNADTPAWMQ